MKFRFLLLALLMTACASAAPEPTREPQIIFITPTPSPEVIGTATEEVLPFRDIFTPTETASPVPPTATLAPAAPTLLAVPATAPPRPPAAIQPSSNAVQVQPTLPLPTAVSPTATALATLVAQPASDVASVEQAIIDLTNAQRTLYGLPPLLRDETIMSIARSRSTDMVARDYFGHNDPATGIHLASEAITASGFGRAGENIYWSGRGSLADFPGLAVIWFMGDSPHRANILNSGYTSIGVGITWNGLGWVLTQDFGGP